MNYLYEYLKKYPDDELSNQAFDKIDTSGFNEQELKDYNDCKNFINNNKESCISLAQHARHPFYRQSILETKEISQVLKYNIDDKGKIFLEASKDWVWDIRFQLLDFVIMPNKELRIGLKHYWMADEASFVYGAGRMIISQEGDVEYADNHSGHYIPNPKQFKQTLNLLSYLNIKHTYTRTMW